MLGSFLELADYFLNPGCLQAATLHSPLPTLVPRLSPPLSACRLSSLPFHRHRNLLSSTELGTPVILSESWAPERFAQKAHYIMDY